MSWADFIDVTGGNLGYAKQSGILPATGFGGSAASGLLGVLGKAAPLLGAAQIIAGIIGGQQEKERMRRAEERRRALELASWASQNYKNAGWGGY